MTVLYVMRIFKNPTNQKILNMIIFNKQMQKNDNNKAISRICNYRKKKEITEDI